MPDVAADAELPASADSRAELLRQIVDGDRHALTIWFQRFKEPVYSFVYYRVGGDVELASDATQSTFMTALEKLNDFDPQRGDMVNWLRYLSRNIIRSLLAEHRRGVQLQAIWDGIDDQLSEALRGIDSQSVPDKVIEREETRQLVGMTLSNLPAQYREVLEAKYMDGQTVQQIATARDVSLDSVKSMLRRARTTFRDSFLVIARVEVHDV